MSTFGFPFQVTCLGLHRRRRSEASVGEVCFDVVLASCCKGKRIPEIKFTELFHLPKTIVRFRKSISSMTKYYFLWTWGFLVYFNASFRRSLVFQNLGNSLGETVTLVEVYFLSCSFLYTVM